MARKSCETCAHKDAWQSFGKPCTDCIAASNHEVIAHHQKARQPPAQMLVSPIDMDALEQICIERGISYIK